MNLRVIQTYRERFPDIVDRPFRSRERHRDGGRRYVLGARVVEKHFTLNRAWKGTDHAFSLEPVGMRKLVRDLRRVRVALGRRRSAATRRSRGPSTRWERRSWRPGPRCGPCRRGRPGDEVAGRRTAAYLLDQSSGAAHPGAPDGDAITSRPRAGRGRVTRPLEGRVAVVTGALRPAGSALVRRAGGCGGDCGRLDLRDRQPLRGVRAFQQTGRRPAPPRRRMSATARLWCGHSAL